MEIARAFVEGEIDRITPCIAQIIFSCTGCVACFEQCNELTWFKANHTEIFEDLKENLVERGNILSKHAKFGEYMEENHNPYYEPYEARFEWLEEGLVQILEEENVSSDVGDIPSRMSGMINLRSFPPIGMTA